MTSPSASALLPPAAYFYHRELKLVGRGVCRPALCPFHSDKHPSLRVNTSTGAFRCFVWDAHGGDVLAPRLRAANADMSRVHFVTGVRKEGDTYPFDPARDTESLRPALVGIEDLRLIVVDPIVSAVVGDSHKNAEVRRGLQPLVDLAQANRCALIGITYLIEQNELANSSGIIASVIR
jgi:hypothetical protein